MIEAENKPTPTSLLILICQEEIRRFPLSPYPIYGALAAHVVS